MTILSKSFLHEDVVLKKCANGKGLFAKKLIHKNSLIIDWEPGPGVVFSTEESYAAEAAGNYFTLQIDHNKHLVSLYTVETCDYINHSCDPNCGVWETMKIVAMRTIRAGEEITFDYSMCESSPQFKLQCNCQTIYCRRFITGNDWKRPDLQKRYGAFFSFYLLKRRMSLFAKSKQHLRMELK